jgi:hypothetical protein
VGQSPRSLDLLDDRLHLLLAGGLSHHDHHQLILSSDAWAMLTLHVLLSTRVEA